MKKVFSALAVFGLLLCLYVFPVSAQDDQAKKIEEGKKYWEKWIEARGGRDRLSKVKEIKSSSDVKAIAQGLNLTMVTYKKGANKFRLEQKVMGMTITMAINGDKSWMIDPASGLVVDMPNQIRSQLALQMGEHEALLNPEQFGHTVTYEGRKTVDGKEYILLNQTSKEGVTATHYIDPGTFLRYKYTAVLNNVASETIESDYRDVEGIKVPFSTKSIQNGQENAVMTVTEYKLNCNLDDSLFERPATPAQAAPQNSPSPKIP
jgi:hypothetical protein